MKEGFRQSMAWLHTWSGLLVGWILFMMFAAGTASYTASYYRDAISLWMKPELHNAAATGLLLWAVKERPKHVKAGRIGFGLRLVDGLNIAAIAGLPLAMAAFFWANRLLPLGLAARQDVEVRCFSWPGPSPRLPRWPGHPARCGASS